MSIIIKYDYPLTKQKNITQAMGEKTFLSLNYPIASKTQAKKLKVFNCAIR